MKYRIMFISRCFILSISSLLLFSFFKTEPGNKREIFPYKAAGLTERQAAAHLLGRFTYGATPGQVDEVVNTGLENWFVQQLNGGLGDDSLNTRLAEYDALKLSNSQIVSVFPRRAKLVRMAIADGFINKDSVNKADKKEYRDQLVAYMKQKGIRPEQELLRQFINQKIVRAAYSNNQLQEMLTEFWFNHFNVSITKNDCAQFIPVYERDAIRPNVTGKFGILLMATAKSPAMLMYLDNFLSSGQNTNPGVQPNEKKLRKLLAAKGDMNDSASMQMVQKIKKAKKGQGLNENYAREIMELHTLGVDGGYTQSDVTQAARVLTGWTIFPMEDGYGGGAMKKIIEKVGENKLTDRGFVHEGDFLFAINRHDNKEKTVLGKTFPANGGYEEGVQLLTMLAHHPSTAKFICKKLAVHFVSDNPPQSLVDKMTNTFMTKDGDIKEILKTMVTSPEFWSKDVIREKTKSPFELAISAARAMKADIQQPFMVFNWIDKMGQKIYFYQAPTGFPDKGQYWINTGALLNRMNFGLAVASQRIPGTKIDLLSLNDRHEPESANAALVTYSKLFMPERNLEATIKSLTPLLNVPDLTKKVEDAAGNTNTPTTVSMVNTDDTMMKDDVKDKKGKKKAGNGLKKNYNGQVQYAAGNNTMLSQVVGIIIGSPEFQRK